jgi:predicted enzyme related to lactoylglutathione lyase
MTDVAEKIRFGHVNVVARDWRRLARFYEEVLGCVPAPPERDLSGDWLDRATGVEGARVRGIHLRLPGLGEEGPTLEIFEYEPSLDRRPGPLNEPGFAHLAFAVDDVEAAARKLVEHGGSIIGERTEREIPGVGRITFQYARDPEGNGIELQRWARGG